MSERKILAFYSPYPGAGKSTTVSAFEYLGVFKISFAEPVRRLTGEALVPFFDGPCEKDELLEDIPIRATFRDFMIAFGQAGRSVWPDIWTEWARTRVSVYKRSTVAHVAIIDDLRFPNEYAMLREEGAKIVRLTVPGREIVPSTTEALLEGYEFDAELENTMDGLDAFREKVRALVREMWP